MDRQVRCRFGQAFQEEFLGMANIEVTYDELIVAREALIMKIHQVLNAEDKEFLLSVKRGRSDWDKIGLSNSAQFPGIQWKLLNISKMDRAKHRTALEKLEQVLT